MPKFKNLARKAKNSYKKTAEFMKKNKGTLRKIDKGIDEGSRGAMGAGALMMAAAPATGPLAPFVAGVGGAAVSAGAVAQLGRQAYRQGANIAEAIRKAKNKKHNKLGVLRDVVSGAAPQPGDSTVYV